MEYLSIIVSGVRVTEAVRFFYREGEEDRIRLHWPYWDWETMLSVARGESYFVRLEKGYFVDRFGVVDNEDHVGVAFSGDKVVIREL